MYVNEWKMITKSSLWYHSTNTKGLSDDEKSAVVDFVQFQEESDAE